MKLLYEFNEDGYYVGPVLSYDVDRFEIPFERLTESAPNNLIRAKFVDGQWVEGADDEYIESITHEAEPNQLDFIAEQNAFLTEELSSAQSVNNDLVAMNAFLVEQLSETQITVKLLAEQQASMLLALSDLQSPPIEDPLPDEQPDEETEQELPEDNDESPIQEEGGNE